jgi:long-chain acyl-CoA synthetase
MTPLPDDVWLPQTTLDPLRRAARERPNATALIAGELALYYRDYAAAVDALGVRLIGEGAGGGTVLILLRNSVAIALAIMGAQAAGAAAAALNPDYSTRELAPMIEDARPRVAIVHADLLEKIGGLLPSPCIVIAVGGDAAFVEELLDAPARLLPEPSPDALALLQFTGGTTGRAKGVELTHRAVATNIAQREAVLPTLFGDEHVLCMMPMFHSFAAAMCLNLATYAAGTLVILPRYRPDWVVDAVERHRITRLPAGPTVFNGLLGFDGLTHERVATLRCAYSGSAPLSADTLARWEARAGVPIYEGYGQSEAGPVLTYQGPATLRKLGSVGPALPLTELRIVDPANPETILPAGVAGEIVARGPQVMRGYRGQPQATAEALSGGWLRTGDIGVLDEDGCLFVTDRKKDMAIVGGFNVYPREIDEVLGAHPDVESVATVAVPDSYRGEVLVAFVVGCATSETLERHCGEQLIRYKHPAAYFFLDRLPLTGVGKIDKQALKVMALEARRTHVA